MKWQDFQTREKSINSCVPFSHLCSVLIFISIQINMNMCTQSLEKTQKMCRYEHLTANHSLDEKKKTQEEKERMQEIQCVREIEREIGR